MNRASHYDNFLTLIGEDPDTTEIVEADFDRYANLCSAEFYALIQGRGLFVDHFYPLAEHSIAVAGGVLAYAFKDATKPQETVTVGNVSVAAGTGITTVTDTGAKFLTTSKLAPGDIFRQSSVDYTVLQVTSETVLICSDASNTIAAATTYTLKTNPAFIVEGLYLPGGATKYRTMSPTIVPLVEGSDSFYMLRDGNTPYRVVGRNIEIAPESYHGSGTACLKYAPQPLTWASTLSTLTNPLPFTDDICMAFDNMVAARYWSKRTEPNINQMKICSAEGSRLLDVIKEAPGPAWSV